MMIGHLENRRKWKSFGAYGAYAEFVALERRSISAAKGSEGVPAPASFSESDA